MKVNDPNLTPAGAPASGAQRSQETGRTARSAGAGAGASGATGSSDDVHLSELVRSLRSLSAESPEREAHIENITRAYAQGSYRVDAETTAALVIRDALGTH